MKFICTFNEYYNQKAINVAKMIVEFLEGIEDASEMEQGVIDSFIKRLNGQCENVEHHWFTSSMAHWRTGSNLLETLDRQRKADMSLKTFKITGCDIYYVPLPADAHYSISDYGPEVDGAIFLEHVEY